MHRWHTNSVKWRKGVKYLQMLNNSVSTLITSSRTISTAKQDVEKADAATTAYGCVCVCVRVCVCACVGACVRACMRVCIDSYAPSLIRSFLDTFNASCRDSKKRVRDFATWHQFICEATGIRARFHTATWLGRFSRRFWRRRSHILEWDTGSRRSTARGLLRTSRSSSVHTARSSRWRGLCQPTSPSCPREPATVRQLVSLCDLPRHRIHPSKSLHYWNSLWHFVHKWYLICWGVIISRHLLLMYWIQVAEF